MNAKLRHGLLLITYGIGLYLLLSNWDKVSGVLGMLYGLMAPFLCGFVVAYLVNRPYVFFRQKAFAGLAKRSKKEKPRWVDALALITAYLVILMVITVIFWIVIPQVIISAKQLGDNISSYMDSLKSFVNDLAAKWNWSEHAVQRLEKLWSDTTNNVDIPKLVNTVSPHLINWTKGIITGVYNWLIGIIVSVYLLASKEKLIRQLKKLVYAVFPDQYTGRLMQLAHVSNDIFGKFIIGRIIDSAIVLVLCLIGMSIFQMPYAMLISVIVGVTNVIPIFGPFIGAIPSAFILLMVDPIKGLWFIVFIIVLQQIDGNIIGPKVVGNSIGLSGIWVMFGVIVGGGLFGVAGMLIGVPILAVIYIVGSELVNRKLAEKNAKRMEE